MNLEEIVETLNNAIPEFIFTLHHNILDSGVTLHAQCVADPNRKLSQYEQNLVLQYVNRRLNPWITVRWHIPSKRKRNLPDWF